MATVQLNGSSIRSLSSFQVQGLRVSTVRISSFASLIGKRGFKSLVVKAAGTVIAPQYTSIKPLGDEVLLKIVATNDKSSGGILLPSTAQTKPQEGEVVAVGEGRTIGKVIYDVPVKAGTRVVFSQYVGTEIEFNGVNHILLKGDDIMGTLDTDDYKDLKPLHGIILIKITEVEEKTDGGLFLLDVSKEKPSIGKVIAVGNGPIDQTGNKKPSKISPGNTVLFSKYAGNELKGSDGDYIALKSSEVIAVLAQ